MIYLKNIKKNIKYQNPLEVDELTFEKGKKHRSLYRTPFGNLEIGTFAIRLLILKSDEKIRIEADYDLELNGSHAAENRIAITIQSVKKA